ncbi:RdgB/HAM1 family non-canonical purine NTP pyrophosphatase [Candidatus Micrarchaeota archaeon]|nr:RdgB/HAM1 family non-canonical purine NTP pyrophosphatase [Candidatus Micrarchaeota archaeon]
MEILFATGNRNKVEEAVQALKPRGITVKHFPFEHNEIRSDSLEEIAREAVGVAYLKCRKPVFVEDSGLFIDSLGGFPGAYSAWTLSKLGLAGILRLLHGVEGRSARFEACVAYHDGTQVSVFKGVCKGAISIEPRGSSGFGYDPIFVPEGRSQTFAENITLKNKLSHRYISLLEFSKSFVSGS